MNQEFMKKQEALKRGYCNHCAAFIFGRHRCGITRDPTDRHLCSLDAKTAARWKSEHNLGIKPIRRPLKKK